MRAWLWGRATAVHAVARHGNSACALRLLSHDATARSVSSSASSHRYARALPATPDPTMTMSHTAGSEEKSSLEGMSGWSKRGSHGRERLREMRGGERGGGQGLCHAVLGARQRAIRRSPAVLPRRHVTALPKRRQKCRKWTLRLRAGDGRRGGGSGTGARCRQPAPARLGSAPGSPALVKKGDVTRASAQRGDSPGRGSRAACWRPDLSRASSRARWAASPTAAGVACSKTNKGLVGIPSMCAGGLCAVATPGPCDTVRGVPPAAASRHQDFAEHRGRGATAMRDNVARRKPRAEAPSPR